MDNGHRLKTVREMLVSGFAMMVNIMHGKGVMMVVVKVLAVRKRLMNIIKGGRERTCHRGKNELAG